MNLSALDEMGTNIAAMLGCWCHLAQSSVILDMLSRYVAVDSTLQIKKIINCHTNHEHF